MRRQYDCRSFRDLKGRLPALLVSAAVATSAARAGTDCSVVDLMPLYWQSVEKTNASARIRTTLLESHPDLYNGDFVNLPPGEKWDATVNRSQKYAAAHRDSISAADRYLSANARPLMRKFQETFPDFKCDFVFYIAPSFGQMDGSAAFVKGKHLIIFAPDVIASFRDLPGTKVLIDHETFHIYHHQTTGDYGAFSEAVPTILQSLWSEGLATFASWRMNPGTSLEAALLQPGIPEGAAPHLADIARDLRAHLDEKDMPTFNHYFVGGDQPPGYPSRAGYYVGTLIAQDLSAHFTLIQLAHLRGPDLRAAVIAALDKLASGG